MDYKAEFMGEGKVEEINGKKIVRMPLPAYFQGHRFRVDFSCPGKIQEDGGPYRVEFILTSEFLLYREDIEKINLEQGYSNIGLGKSTTSIKSVDLWYEKLLRHLEKVSAQNTDAWLRKNATLTFKTKGNYIQRFIIQLPEDRIDMAIHLSEQIINSILDVISFRKQLPLQIRQIEIFHEPSNTLLRSYVTIPYTTDKDIDRCDFELALSIPSSLKPILRLYREAINSCNPHYRLLCFYRMYEGLKKVWTKNSKEVIAKGKQPTRTRLHVPDNELTKQNFPSLVGKSFNAFLDYVYKEYRNAIAHLKFDYPYDKMDKMLLDPSNVIYSHKIDITNAVLEQIMHRWIIEELKFMQEHKLE